MNILVVDDEGIVALDIAQALEEMGHKVTGIAKNSEKAMEMSQKVRPDLALMDINLGEGPDGIDTAAYLKECCDIPVIYLTAYSGEKTISRAIETDPLGYIVKPFKEGELLAAVRLAAYKRRKKNVAPDSGRSDLGKGYAYAKASATLFYGEMEIPLTKNERKLISLLVDARGTIVPFERIEYEIWPDKAVSESTRRTLIYRLNSKLDHQIIQTLSGVGCKIDMVS
jgi:DNA-binding response OmpR family regulator